MRHSLKQVPITNSTDEIFDPEWKKDKKIFMRAEYRRFFRTLPHRVRRELGELINDYQS